MRQADGQGLIINPVQENVTQSEVQLLNNVNRDQSIENARNQTRSVVADKNRTFILNDFLPKVDSMPQTQPTQSSIDPSTFDLNRSKDKMNATLVQFGSSGKKANPVESIAARIANRQII